MYHFFNCWVQQNAKLWLVYNQKNLTAVPPVRWKDGKYANVCGHTNGEVKINKSEKQRFVFVSWFFINKATRRRSVRPSTSDFHLHEKECRQSLMCRHLHEDHNQVSMFAHTYLRCFLVFGIRKPLKMTNRASVASECQTRQLCRFCTWGIYQ